jgi:ferredoxin
LSGATVSELNAVACPQWSGDLTQLLRWAADEPEIPDIELVCAEHGDASRGSAHVAAVRVPGCLANVSMVSYLELLAAGIVHVALRIDECPQAAQVQRIAAEVCQFLEASGRDATLSCATEPSGRRRRPEFDLRRLPMSRRRLLLLAVPKAHQVPDTTAPERERTVAALGKLHLRVNHGQSALGTLPAPSADLVTSDCNGCGVCIRSCPTGALTEGRESQEAGQAFQLLFSARLCIDCQRCVSLCPEHALSRTGTASWEQLVEERQPRLLAIAQLQRCTRCHAMFRPTDGEQYCSVCTFRAANPFGSRVTSGIPPQ